VELYSIAQGVERNINIDLIYYNTAIASILEIYFKLGSAINKLSGKKESSCSDFEEFTSIIR